MSWCMSKAGLQCMCGHTDTKILDICGHTDTKFLDNFDRQKTDIWLLVYRLEPID